MKTIEEAKSQSHALSQMAASGTPTPARRRRRLGLQLTLCLALAGGSAWAQGLSVQELSLSGLTLVQDSRSLDQQMGRPVVLHRTTDSATGEPASIRVFPTVTAYLVNGEIMRLKTTDTETPTPAGAKVGDSVQTVLDLYPGVQPRHRSDERLELQVEGTEALLIFHLYRQRVITIEIRLDYA